MGLSIGHGIGIPFKKSGISWQSYWTTPNKSDQLFCLPGITFESGGNTYLRDVSGNKRHFLITGLDWSDDSRVIDILPFKTLATISAPAGDTALIAADINNFLYDSGGTPNALSPQAFFQNIDYVDKLFCRHTDQSLNADNTELIYSGIKDITLYANAQTGDNLTTCNTYFSVPTRTAGAIWVAKNGNDTTGNGAEATPYLTIDKAMSVVSNGATKTIYIKTGNYNEATSGYDYLHKTTTYQNKKFTFYGIGRTRVTSNNATYVIRDADTGSCHLTGIEIYGSQTQPFHSQYMTAISNITRCKFNSGTVYALPATVTKSCFNASSLDCYADVATPQTVTQNYFYGKSCLMYNRSLLARKSIVTYNKFYQDDAANYQLNISGTYFDVLYNVVKTQATLGLLRVTYYNTTAGVSNFNYNNINIHSGFVIQPNTACYHSSFTISHNTINHTHLTEEGSLLYAAKYIQTLTMENNTVTSLSKVGFSFVNMIPVTAYPVAISIKKNYIDTKSTTLGAIINFSEAAIANVYDGAEIMYNYLKGGIVENYLETLNVHGILARSGKNMKIAYNWIEDCAIGIVYKNEGVANTSGGIYGNVLINNRVGICLRGCNEARIYNNVVYLDNTPTNTNSYFITADFHVSNNTNCFFENNIFVRFNSVVNVALFNIQAASLAAGTKIKRNIVYCPDYTAGHWLYDGASYYSLADSITNGYAENINETNPQITASRPYPVPAIEGATDLGADFDDGLDVTSVWAEAVVLKAQGANWQYGAFVQ